MSSRAFDQPDDRLSTLRRLRTLVVALLVSNIGLGLFGFFVLREVDRKYSTLIAETVPSLNELQTLTAASMDAMRTTNPVVYAAPGADRASLVAHGRESFEREGQLRQHALARAWLKAKPAEREGFRAAGENFTARAQEVIGLIESGDMTQASSQREKILRPVFDQYIGAMTKVADMLEADSLRTNDSLTARTGSISHMMLGIGGWPLMVLGGFLLVAALFIVSVLLKVLLSRQEAL